MAGRVRGFGEYRADEAHVVWTGRLHQPSVPVVPALFIHGATAGGDQFMTRGWDDEALALADRGLVVMSADFGGQNTFGNGLVQDSIDDAIAWLADVYGTRTDKVAFYAASAGAPGALNWARQTGNPARVAALAAIVPAVDVDYLHDGDVGGLRDEIEGAYGGAGSYEAGRLLYDPALHHADYAPFAARLRAFYAPDDPLIPAGQVTAFTAGVGCTAASIGNVGHNPQQADPQPIVDWLTTTIRRNS